MYIALRIAYYIALVIIITLLMLWPTTSTKSNFVSSSLDNVLGASQTLSFGKKLMFGITVGLFAIQICFVRDVKKIEEEENKISERILEMTREETPKD